jgi:deoxycytidylate deaminase
MNIENRWAKKMMTAWHLAQELSRLALPSHPLRKVGCVIVTEDFKYVAAIGYNGCPPGEDPKEDESSDLHAEVNALMKLENHWPSQSLVMLVTTAPCFKCAGYVLASNKIKTMIAPMARFKAQDARPINGGRSIYLPGSDKLSQLFEPSDGAKLLLSRKISVFAIEAIEMASNADFYVKNQFAARTINGARRATFLADRRVVAVSDDKEVVDLWIQE